MIKKSLLLAIGVALAIPVTAQAAFKEFSLSGHSATTYNERGYTLGIDMVKEKGQKVFYASIVLPEGDAFKGSGVSSSYAFDSQPSIDLSSLDAVGQTSSAISWEVDRFSDDVVTIPKNSDLYEFMKRYHVKFTYINAQGDEKKEKIGLNKSAATLSELITR